MFMRIKKIYQLPSVYIQIIKTYIQTYSKVSWDWNGYKISGEMIVYLLVRCD